MYYLHTSSQSYNQKKVFLTKHILITKSITVSLLSDMSHYLHLRVTTFTELWAMCLQTFFFLNGKVHVFK